MHIELLVVGLLLVVFIVVDALWTTLWVDGHAGPFTRRYTSMARLIFWRVTSRRNHRLMSVSGPVVLVSTVFTWGLCLWLGWVLTFSADPGSLIRVSTRAPATLVDRIYFTGYAIATLGNGDIAPNRGIWELATSVASLSGLFVLTLTVTYVLTVLDAVVEKRSFASHVITLGRTAEAFILNAWTGSDFRGVELQIVSLTEQLNRVSEQHQAYPMLHYYHEEREIQSVPLGLAIYDDAMMLFAFAVRAEVRPSPSALRAAREAASVYLNTLKTAYIAPTKLVAPPPDLERLRQAGIPLVGDDEIEQALRINEERRRLLKGFLDSEHRDWPLSRG